MKPSLNRNPKFWYVKWIVMLIAGIIGFIIGIAFL
jgi:preprotein translocase subunit Sss1